MTEDRDRPHGGFHVGEEFDEDEATVLDARRPVPAAAPVRIAEDDDDDATEVMSAVPAAGAPVPPSVVPIGESAARLVGETSAAPPPEVDDDPDDATLQLSRPPSRAPAGDGSFDVLAPMSMEGTPAKVRPLGSISHDEFDDDDDDVTLSRPKVVRMSFKHDPPPIAPDGSDFANADTSKKKPPSTSGARSLLSADRSPPPDLDAPDDAEQLGHLVVDVPDDAIVFIDGDEIGWGAVELAEVDRYAQLTLRVHRPGFRPWTQTVSLGGEPTLKVSPTFEPK